MLNERYKAGRPAGIDVTTVCSPGTHFAEQRLFNEVSIALASSVILHRHPCCTCVQVLQLDGLQRGSSVQSCHVSRRLWMEQGVSAHGF